MIASRRRLQVTAAIGYVVWESASANPGGTAVAEVVATLPEAAEDHAMEAGREAGISALEAAGWDSAATQFANAYDDAQTLRNPWYCLHKLDELLDDATTLCESRVWITDEVSDDLRFAISEVVLWALDAETADQDVLRAAWERSANAVAAVHAHGSDAFDLAWIGAALVLGLAAGAVAAQVSYILTLVAFAAVALVVYRGAGAYEHRRVKGVSQDLIAEARSLERDARQYAIEGKLADGDPTQRRQLEWRAARINQEASTHRHAASLLECFSGAGGDCLCREWRTKYSSLYKSSLYRLSFEPGMHRCAQCALRIDARR